MEASRDHTIENSVSLPLEKVHLFEKPRGPFDLLTAEDVRQYLGYDRVDTVYAIPEIDLPKRRIGGGRRLTRYYWIDVVCYVSGLPPLDMQHYLEEQMRRALRPLEPARVHPAPGVAPKRERII